MGLAYVAPIGLQNLFVINSALTHTRKRALLTALIVIFFDVTLALACLFGVGAVMQRYEWLQMVILLLGSLIVLYIGVGLLRAKAEEIDRSRTADSIPKTISSACVVTWFNPQALIDGTMMLGAFYVTLPAAQSTSFISGARVLPVVHGADAAHLAFQRQFHAQNARCHQQGLRRDHRFLRLQAALQLPDDGILISVLKKAVPFREPLFVVLGDA